MFINTILGKVYVIDSNRVKKNGLLANILESIRHRFASYDMLMQQMPISIINLARWLLISLILYGFYSYSNGVNDLYLFSGDSILRIILSKIFGNEAINISPGINALFISMITAIWFRFRFRIETYFASSFIAIYLFIVENHRIKKISLGKKIIYTLTWPIFDIIGRYTSYVALFTNVTWKPIPHNSTVTIDDVDTSKNGA